MKEILEALGATPDWAVYLVLWFAAFKALVSLLLSVGPAAKSARAKKRLEDLGKLSTYFITLVVAIGFFAIERPTDVRTFLVVVLTVLSFMLFGLVIYRYAKQHPDPTPRAPLNSSRRNPEKDQKLPRYFSIRPQQPRISQSLRLTSSTTKARRAPRS